MHNKLCNIIGQKSKGEGLHVTADFQDFYDEHQKVLQMPRSLLKTEQRQLPEIIYKLMYYVRIKRSPYCTDQT